MLSPLLACRLIAIDKKPGVRPIGIGEVVRRVVAKAALTVLRPDILEAAGVRQLCAGQTSGVESAVHSIHELFKESEAVLLVDARNAFNSLNRLVALHNIKTICPDFATILINCYRAPSSLFIEDHSLLSQEGTTQGDPLSMPFYALSTLPSIDKLPDSVKQLWYADDAAAVGSIDCLKQWWDSLNFWGPKFGYFPNSSKTWLVTKKDFCDKAKAIFANSNVNITTHGRPYLGVPLGSSEFINEFVSDKIESWISEIKVLSRISVCQPHAAFSALTHGLMSKWMYISRTVPDISDHLQSLEVALSTVLIPGVTGRAPAPSAVERDLLALPARLGGLGIRDPSVQAASEYDASMKVCQPIVSRIVSNRSDYDFDCECCQIDIKVEIRNERREYEKFSLTRVMDSLDPSKQRMIKLAGEKGASSWLTCLPIQEHGFSLHKRAFFDALALRYVSCVCGSTFTVEHALSCLKGGFPSIRHNELRDFTASVLTEVCNDVLVEPPLQPLSGEELTLTGASANTSEGARLDIAANGFWGGRFEKTFLDIRVFNPHAPSYKRTSIENCYIRHEREKKRMYERRIIEVEHSTFTPLVFSVSGGMAKECTNFYKRLASLLAEKRDQHYNDTLRWLRCSISFMLLRSAVQCIRGARSSIHKVVIHQPIDLVLTESMI